MALKGIKVIELAGLAPVPFCGMILADFGASVIRVDKFPAGPDLDCLGNGKKSLLLNLKSKEGVTVLKKLIRTADILIEPFRPGVMERLGLGPKVLIEENNRLIYARLSGFGQTGPLSSKPGHDINYVALSGLLSIIGGKGKIPCPPVNFAADFAGGGLLCALGILMALFDRSNSGLGQVIDCNMTSGAAYVGSWLFRSRSLPLWTGPRGTNVLDGGHHYYGCYETKDGKFMAVGAIEPKFYDKFMEGLGLSREQIPQFPGDCKQVKETIERIFKQQTQEYWNQVFKDLDACVTPVLDLSEAAALNKFHKCEEDTWAPHPAPLLSRTPGQTQGMKPSIFQGQHTLEILKEIGISNEDIEELSKNKIIFLPSKI